MRYDQNNLKYIFMMTAVTILTFRSKEMAAVLIILLLYLLFVKYKFQGNALILAPVAGLAIYFHQISLINTSRFTIMRR